MSRVFEVRAVGPILACCAHTAEATGGGPGDESCAVMCRCGACLVVASGAFPHIYMGRGHSKVMCIHVHVHVCTCACTCMCMYMHLRVCMCTLSPHETARVTQPQASHPQPSGLSQRSSAPPAQQHKTVLLCIHIHIGQGTHSTSP